MKNAFRTAMVILSLTTFLIGAQAFGAEGAKYGGTLKVILSLPAMSFGYPPKIRTIDEMYASIALETPLVVDVRGKIHPHLATSWGLAKDGKSWIIKLRKGVKFHDGTLFNAEAFKFNMDMWVGKPTGAFRKLTSVEVIDDYTVRLNASQYDSLVPFELSTEAFIVSPKAIKEHGAKWAETHPVGTGAFKFVSYDRPNKLTWTRFDEYWQRGRPYLDGVEYLFIKDRMTALSALKAGEAHGIFFALPQHAKTMGKQGWDISYDNAVGIHIYVDSVHPSSPWANKKVRKAVEYAIDKEAICNQLGLGFKLPVYQIVKSDNTAYVKGLPPRKYDPEKARQLLREAGYPNGFKADFYYINVGWKDGWQAVQSYLSAVGINLKLIPVDRPKFMSIRFKKGTLPVGSGAMMVCWMPPNALYMARNLLSSKTPHLPEMKRPEGFDKLTEMAIGEKDPAKRLALTRQLVKLAYEEEMFIPFFAEGPLVIMNPKVKGYDFFEYGRNNLCPYIDAYIEK
ncbi:MAG: ABC transporter substrate-binding protein [Deltaproteobacteria bacterium]|nr:ABC transporter substrate-binding protein [Deltaproteobacteria bacterium]